VERYHKAVRTLGKGGKVENLIEGILEDVQCLANIKTFTTMSVEKVIKMVTADQEEKIAKAITNMATSVSDNMFRDRTYTNTNYFPVSTSLKGAEQNVFQGESRQCHTGGGAQTLYEGKK
jgi:hypothetical protein